MEQLSFLTEEQVRSIQQEFGTPVFVYDQKTLEEQAACITGFPNAFGCTGRYAMKALPTAAVVKVLSDARLHIDASSGFEAVRAMKAGVPAEHIRLTAQELAGNLKELVEQGVLFTACSLRQLAAYGELFPGTEVCVRVNPGLGTGHNNRTNVGGPSSSFGIWHEHLDEVFDLARKHKLTITTIHTHIGSGGDPDVWVKCARMTLGIVPRMPDVATVGLGGGFKVGRMTGETSADMNAIGGFIKKEFEAFREEHGRELHLEIEPGTFLVANAGVLVASVVDVVDTGAEGYAFIKTDSGMTEVLRPSLYGAQHPLVVVPRDAQPRGEKDYLVVGHCCESGDVLTPEPGNPEGLLPRTLTEARVGDALVIGGAGAYCSAMASKNYNSFPEAAEVMVDRDGAARLIRKRQTLEQILVNEVLPG